MPRKLAHLADEIRNKILSLGYVVKDTREGYQIEKQ